MFNHILILTRKEVRSFFMSPTAYILSAIFLFLMGWLFFNHLQMNQDSSIVSLSANIIVPLFGNINFIFLFLMPLITMRSFAEEQREQTLDLLLTSKLTHLEIILGKTMGMLCTISFMMMLSFIFPIILAFIGYRDWPFLLTGYLGLFLNAWAYGMVGLMVSSFTIVPLLSAVGSFFLLVGLLLISQSAAVISNFMLSQMVGSLSIVTHFIPFSQGVINIKDLVYFASFIIYMIYLMHLSLNRRYW